MLSDASGHLSTNTFTYLVLPSIADEVFEASKSQIETLGDLLQAISANNEILNKYTTLINQVAGTTQSVEALGIIETYIKANLPALQTANSEAVKNIADEKVQNTQATQNIADLTPLNQEANTLKTDLGAIKTAADVSKLALDNSKIAADKSKDDLDNSKTAADSTKVAIEDDITTAEQKIAAMQAFGDVTQVSQDISALKTETEGARGGEENLGARLDKFDTSLSESVQQLGDIAVYNATCTYSSPNFTLTLANAPATLPSYFTIRVKMPSAWIDGSTIVIGTKTYTVNNAGFVANEVVVINFDEVASTCFFKSGGGGGGLTETLPQQVDTFTAVSGDGIINLAWSISNTSYLAGFYIVFKPGSTPPTTLNDGTKIDIANATATSQQITSVTNGTQYSFRIMPYNSKKQVQTQYKVATATPLDSLLISSLELGSKIMLSDQYNGANLTFIVIDKNHAEYPPNSVTLATENCIASMAFGTSTDYSTSSARTWLEGTFYNLLTTIKSNILDTTLKFYCDSLKTITGKVFLMSQAELFGIAENNIFDGTKFAYFTSDASRIAKYNGTAYYYLTRTKNLNNGASVKSVSNTGSAGAYGFYDHAECIRPALNVSSSVHVSLSPNAQGYYTLM